MTVKEYLYTQTHDAYNWVNKLVNDIDYSEWNNIQSGIESNITWQIGHLILSYYYHTVMVIKGHDMDFLSKVPMKELSPLFGYGSKPSESIGDLKIETLREFHSLAQATSMNTIENVSEEDLQSAIQPVGPPHPIAKTKFEAIDWNIKHTMWHCGQIGVIKKMLGEGHKFM